MKVKTKEVSYAYVETLQSPKRKPLVRPNFFLRLLIRILSEFELATTKFTYTQARMEEAKDKPCLILMNHSSFLDLKIASKLFFPTPYYIVSTMDGMIGKEGLMRHIGCIPTRKFVSDVGLVRDIGRALHKKQTSVLMFPEAGYTFDGCTTVLPKHLGNLIKSLKVPVVTVITDGAFLYQPLYNDLRIRKTPVSAHVECMLTPAEIEEKSVDEINTLLDQAFSFDNFRTQKEKGNKISAPDRAAGLERILYRCPACQTEGKMRGEKHTITCQACGKTYEMDELGQLHATNGETEFSHIPDWTNWERECVRKEVEEGSYRMELPVNIGIVADHKALYMVGEGTFVHDDKGYTLTNADGSLQYTQSPIASYTLNSDFNWYEIGDVIGIGDMKRLYYCFPKIPALVTKARYAAEEMYKLKKN
ncbi:MAG: 1-acyl-sn-glycerol-3-phosphate acyltransferase [Clostridia bacterium]|nr:1-acyl-sn-glycerol-3-phosphate acyltransferase [Clostridia bacterium]